MRPFHVLFPYFGSFVLIEHFYLGQSLGVALQMYTIATDPLSL
jgi:hypothetical protein